MKNLLSMLVLLSISSAANPQQCRVYFTVAQSDPHLPGGSMAAMSPKQEKWWTKNGAKKYPGICYDSDKATYKVVWWKQTVSDNFEAKNVADPRFDTTIHSTREIGSAYVKAVNAPDSEKPIFIIEDDRRGTADALEKALVFLSKVGVTK
ncbi:MAG TPA: hypothetical protein VKA02_05505 [Candidatus Acidoferrum sp.]|nr:hypothetical protein [Candidatus Acidoferrum sp.]